MIRKRSTALEQSVKNIEGLTLVSWYQPHHFSDERCLVCMKDA